MLFNRQIYLDVKSMLFIGLPLVCNNLSSIGVAVADTVMTSRIGSEHLAAIALGSGVWISFFLLGVGTLMSIGPTTAQNFGAKKFEAIDATCKQGFWLATFISILVVFAMRSFEPILHLMKIELGVIFLTQRYLDYLSWGVPAAFLYHTLKQTSEGVGRTLPIMVIMFVAFPINIILNYFFINGFASFEPMGASGSGLGSAIAFWLMFFALAIYVFKSDKYSDFLKSDRLLHSLNTKILKELVALGFPIGMNLFFQSALFTSAALILGSMGSAILAAHQIVLNWCALVFMVPLGVAMSLTVLVGQSMGEGHPVKAKRIGITGIFFCFLISLFSVAITLFNGLTIARFYSGDQEIIAVVMKLFMVAAFLQVGDAVQTAATFSLRGLKDTKIPMLLSAFNSVVIGFIGALFLGVVCDFRELGVWTGLSLSLILTAIILSIRFFNISTKLTKNSSINLNT